MPRGEEGDSEAVEAAEVVDSEVVLEEHVSRLLLPGAGSILSLQQYGSITSRPQTTQSETEVERTVASQVVGSALEAPDGAVEAPDSAADAARLTGGARGPEEAELRAHESAVAALGRLYELTAAQMVLGGATDEAQCTEGLAGTGKKDSAVEEGDEGAKAEEHNSRRRNPEELVSGTGEVEQEDGQVLGKGEETETGQRDKGAEEKGQERENGNEGPARQGDRDVHVHLSSTELEFSRVDLQPGGDPQLDEDEDDDDDDEAASSEGSSSGPSPNLGLDLDLVPGLFTGGVLDIPETMESLAPAIAPGPEQSEAGPVQQGPEPPGVASQPTSLPDGHTLVEEVPTTFSDLDLNLDFGHAAVTSAMLQRPASRGGSCGSRDTEECLPPQCRETHLEHERTSLPRRPSTPGPAPNTASVQPGIPKEPSGSQELQHPADLAKLGGDTEATGGGSPSLHLHLGSQATVQSQPQAAVPPPVPKHAPAPTSKPMTTPAPPKPTQGREPAPVPAPAPEPRQPTRNTAWAERSERSRPQPQSQPQPQPQAHSFSSHSSSSSQVPVPMAVPMPMPSPPAQQLPALVRPPSKTPGAAAQAVAQATQAAQAAQAAQPAQSPVSRPLSWGASWAPGLSAERQLSRRVEGLAPSTRTSASTPSATSTASASASASGLSQLQVRSPGGPSPGRRTQPLPSLAPGLGSTSASSSASALPRRRQHEPAKVRHSDGRVTLRGVRSVSDLEKYAKGVDLQSRKGIELRAAFKTMRSTQHSAMAQKTWSALYSLQASERTFEEWYETAKDGATYHFR